ncbi:MAG: hypothetical protein IBJ18_06020 [Phycisphaerales bacterium]|nr:hypothetical protein [Phycisphaerales bacterium]
MRFARGKSARSRAIIALGVLALSPCACINSAQAAAKFIAEFAQAPAQPDQPGTPAPIDVTNFPQGPINRVSEAVVERAAMLVERVIVPWDERPRDRYRVDDAASRRSQIRTDQRAINELHRVTQDRFRLRRLELEPTKETAATRAKLQELAAIESDLNAVLMPMFNAASQALLEPKVPEAVQTLRTIRGRTVASESLRRVLLASALIERADAESLREASQLIMQILELPEGNDPRRACPSAIVGWALLLSSLHELPTPEGTKARLDARMNDVHFRSLHAIAQARAIHRRDGKGEAAISRAIQPLVTLLNDHPREACEAMVDFVRVADVPLNDRPYVMRAMVVVPEDSTPSLRKVLVQREPFRTLPRPLRSLIVDGLKHDTTLYGVYELSDLTAYVDAIAPFVEKDAPPDATESAKIDTLIAAARTLMKMDSGESDEFVAVARRLLESLASAADRDAVHLGENAQQRRGALLWLPVAVALAPGAPPEAIERSGKALTRAMSEGEAGRVPPFVTASETDCAVVISRIGQLSTLLTNDVNLQGVDAAGALRALEPTLKQIESAGIAGSKGLARAACYARAVHQLRTAPAGSASVPEADRLIEQALASPVGRVPSSVPTSAGFIDDLLRARWAHELAKAGRFDAALRINRELTDRLANPSGMKDASLREAFWLAWAGKLEELARADVKANATEIRLQLRRLTGLDPTLGGRATAARFRAVEAALPPL